MARFVSSGALLLISLSTPPALFAAESTVVNFAAKIFDGTCQIELSNSVLEFGLHKAIDFKPNSAVAILPLTASVSCSGSTTPKLTVTGSTPYSSSAIFRDAESLSTGSGFMVRRNNEAIDLANFYDEAKAINNNVPISLTPIAVADTVQDESFLLGLVRAGSNNVTPGAIKATLTFSIAFD
ncbi:fimbrial protein [Serratia microhaemolytica]|uniref:fimbrial protein n=1 Tax=Serratia microhaemolytica TaxID=2675110 RepID=UPI000FDD68A0|nr:fimbrial protein [Serratia microhaemolytica]